MYSLYEKCKKLSKKGIEVWRWVKNHKGLYKVSNLGRVKSLDRTSKHALYGLRKLKGKMLSLSSATSGHITVTLSNGITRKTYLVHHLVLEAFYKLRPKGKDTRHLNGKSFDNRLFNLRYGTRKQNVADAIKHGTFTIGVNNGNACFTEKEVRYIKRKLSSNSRGIITRLADKFGVHRHTIRKIKHNHTYIGVTP